MWSFVLLGILLILLIIRYYFLYYNYWCERGVTAVNPIYTFYNFTELVFMVTPRFSNLKDIYFKHQDKRYVGLFQYFRPILMVHDLDLIKKITITDFESFTNHNIYPNVLCADKLFQKNVFSMAAKDGWYELRGALTPFFTGSKLRRWYSLMQVCSTQILDYLNSCERTDYVDVRDLFERYSNDVIGSATLGVSCNSVLDRDNAFFHGCKSLADFSGMKGITYVVYSLYPRLLKIIAPSLLKSKMTNFFLQLIRENMLYRLESNIVRDDIVGLLSKYVQSGRKETSLNAGGVCDMTIEEVTAGAGTFLIAGFQTVAYTITTAAYELALNPEIQEKVCTEIEEVLNEYNGELTFEAINSMNYIENVIFEALRIHLVFSIIDRRCTKNYTIEPVHPGEKPVHLKEGDCVWIPAGPIHHDPKHYPNPQKFDPDRFGKNKPFSLMPFGIGPKSCLGVRFAMLECKLILVEILRSFDIVPVKKTISSLPTFKDTSFGLSRKTLSTNFK
ncbi:cytochrome P450 9e2-like isoform X1 [Photinus pyralis]|uniref:cytochrome P450 9e2-like isoform X1 n=1 Tax=Photinus pyralis TaxID=7054 RepID=UPI0012673EFA|nr:cytochrome P450 9e2-like isoform X1 [Photinus pyralis]